MTLVLALILVPILAGLGLGCVRPDAFRKWVVSGVTLAVCCGAVALATLPTPVGLGDVPFNHHWLNLGCCWSKSQWGFT